MLTKDDKKVVKALIILTSIVLACIIAAAILIVITKYYGFIVSTPINCSHPYFKLKFTTANQFLSVSFSMLAISFITFGLLLAQFVILMVRIGRKRDANGNSLEEKLPSYYIIACIAQLGITVMLGWYLSIFFEAGKKCSYSVSIQLIIIVACGSLAFLIGVIIWCIIVYLAGKRPKLGQPLVFQQRKSEKQKQSKEQKQGKLQLKEKLSEKKIPLLEKQVKREPYQQKPIQYNLNAQNTLRIPQTIPQQTKVPIPIPYDHNQNQFQRRYSQSSQQRQRYQPQKRQTIIIKQQPRYLPQPQAVTPSVPSPPSQNVTHINFNFPNNFNQNPLPTITNQPQKDKVSQPNLKREKTHEKNSFSRKSVIKQSSQQDRQSDSDDRFYKKGKKNKQRSFKFQQNRKKQSKYERQYDEIDNKFEHSPLEPRYVVLSPDSMKKFYQFVNSEQAVQDKHANKRNFIASKAKNHKRDKAYPPQIPKYSNSKLSLSPKPHFQVTVIPKSPKDNQNQRLKDRQYIFSQVNEGFNNNQQLNHKQRSFYQQLQDKQSFRDDFKKYQRFFNSRAISQPQKLQFPSSFDQYFDILNNSIHTKEKHSGSQLQSNYSSILNQQVKGKIPTQRQSNQRKVRLDENQLKQISTKRTESFYNKIKQKYK